MEEVKILQWIGVPISMYNHIKEPDDGSTTKIEDNSENTCSKSIGFDDGTGFGYGIGDGGWDYSYEKNDCGSSLGNGCIDYFNNYPNSDYDDGVGYDNGTGDGDGFGNGHSNSFGDGCGDGTGTGSGTIDGCSCEYEEYFLPTEGHKSICMNGIYFADMNNQIIEYSSDEDSGCDCNSGYEFGSGFGFGCGNGSGDSDGVGLGRGSGDGIGIYDDDDHIEDFLEDCGFGSKLGEGCPDGDKNRSFNPNYYYKNYNNIFEDDDELIECLPEGNSRGWEFATFDGFSPNGIGCVNTPFNNDGSFIDGCGYGNGFGSGYDNGNNDEIDRNHGIEGSKNFFNYLDNNHFRKIIRSKNKKRFILGNKTDQKEGLNTFLSKRVYYIDNIPCHIYSIHNNIAKVGVIDIQDMSIDDCYIAKYENCFYHAKTMREAIIGAQKKYLSTIDVEKRIKMFKEKFNSKNKKYPAKDFYEWHTMLTGSCTYGKNQFVENERIDLKKDKFTVNQFIELTKNQYGSDIIQKLK